MLQRSSAWRSACPGPTRSSRAGQRSSSVSSPSVTLSLQRQFGKHGAHALHDVLPGRLAGLDVGVYAAVVARVPAVQQVAQRQQRRGLAGLPRRVQHEVLLVPHEAEHRVEIDPLQRRDLVVVRRHDRPLGVERAHRRRALHGVHPRWGEPACPELPSASRSLQPGALGSHSVRHRPPPGRGRSRQPRAPVRPAPGKLAVRRPPATLLRRRARHPPGCHTWRWQHRGHGNIVCRTVRRGHPRRVVPAL